MPRWSLKEQTDIDSVRSSVVDLLSEAPPYPEVVGDRKIVRFLRGHDHNIEKVCTLYRKFLTWRKENGINEVRKDIVERGCDHPLKFPKGELILSLIPQLVLAPDAHDKMGCPICVEQYNFSPSDVLSKITIQDYITFVIYSLEYRSLLLEDISEKRERERLALMSEEEMKNTEYGVIVYSCVVRDLNGVGFEHLGSKGQEIIKAVVNLASDNYPELMRKCFMINVPWIFNTVWYFVKGLLAPKTISKIAVMGTGFLPEIMNEIDSQNLPQMIGGRYTNYMSYISYAFDQTYLCSNKIEELNHVSINDEDRDDEHRHSVTEEAAELVNEIEAQCRLRASFETPKDELVEQLSDIRMPGTTTPVVSSSVKLLVSDQTSSEIDINLISLQTSGF